MPKRSDGRRIRTLDPMNRVAGYIMSTRAGASNSFRYRIEVTELEKYIHAKRREGWKGFGLLHVFIAAYARVVSQQPSVNRFISGQECYARNDITVSLAVKKGMALDAQETIVKLVTTPYATVQDVYESMNALIRSNREDGDRSGMDHVARFLNYIPGLFLRFAVWVLRTMDYFGILPASLLQISPFHAGLFVTSMASLGIPPVIHHLYEFGNVPIFLSFGMKYPENVLQKDGTVAHKTYVDFTVNTDDRICDGFNYASAAKRFMEILAHPEQLDNPPETVVQDIP